MKTIFWNVDTQYDFMRNDADYQGKLAIPHAQLIEPNLAALTQYARENGIKIINTADWHTQASKEFADQPDFKTTFPAHCLQNTKGAAFVPATRPENPYMIDWQLAVPDLEKAKAAQEIVMYKDAFDIFAGNPYADAVVQAINPDRIIVYGVATNVCVDFAVIGNLVRGKEVIVPLDAIKEIPGLPLEATLAQWKRNGAVLVATKDIADYVR